MKTKICPLILMAILFFPFYAGSQSVRASVDSSEVYVGQPFEFRITIEDSTESDPPDLPDIDGLKIEYKGASTTMVSSFGTGGNSSSRTITHSWYFTPIETGSIKLPSIAVSIDGRTYYTKEGTIHVRNAEPFDGFHLLMNTDKDEYWMGEPILMNIKWLFSSSVSSPTFNIPFIDSGQFSVESQTPPTGSDVYRISISGLEVLTRQSAEIFRGDQYSTLSFQLKLMPHRSGNFRLEPITLAFDRAEKTGGFRTTYKATVIPSNSLDISVKELPPEAGDEVILSAGNLIIESSADPQKVHIGDPLSYKISVRGALDPDNVSLPSLNSIPSLAGNFSIPDRRSPGKVEGDKVVFTQTIRVKNDMISSIPQFSISYFNTESGTLEKALVPSVPIEVMETQVVTSADLENTGYNRVESDNREKLITNEEGILHNFGLKRTALLKGGNMEAVSSSLYILWLLLPVLLFLSLLAFKKRSKLFKWKTNDFYDALRQLQSSDNNSVLESIREYLHKYSNVDSKELTSQELYDLLVAMGNDRQICDAIRDLLIQLESNAFSKEDYSDTADAAGKFYSLSKELL